jgi:hypothetical protein
VRHSKSWEGFIAGARGIAVVRQVAARYGMRPGPAVTFVLFRKVAWIAAGTVGVAILAPGVAERESLLSQVSGQGYRALRRNRTDEHLENPGSIGTSRPNAERWTRRAAKDAAGGVG